MIQMETTATPISKELKDKIKRICEFARVTYSIEEGSIVDFIGTNIAFAKPHVLKVKNNDYLIFEDSNIVYINGYDKKIKFSELASYLKN